MIEAFFSVAVGFFSNDLIFFIFTTRRFQVEHADNQTEHHEVDSEEDNTHHQQHPDVLAGGRQVIHQRVVDSPRREGEARVDTQQRCHKQADTGQQCVQEVQQRCKEHEQEFQRLSHTGQERSNSNRKQHPANHRTTLFRCCEVHRQRRTRQTEHHNREEAGHEHPRGAVTGIEAVDITVENRTRRVGEFTNLEPGDGVQHLMQTGWDQQTVDETKDTGTQRARRNDPLASCMDSVLYRRPDVTKNGRQHQAEEAGGDRHKAFAAEEAQEVRQFNIGPTVIGCTTDQTGNDTRQYTHVNFRVDGHHRFG